MAPPNVPGVPGTMLPPRPTDKELALRREIEELRVERERLLERIGEHVRHKSVAPPPSERTAPAQLPPAPKGTPPWVKWVATVLVSLMGGVGVRQAVQPSAADYTPQFEAVRTDIRGLRVELRESVEYDRRVARDIATRDGITQDLLCRLNAKDPKKPSTGAFARGVDCNSVEWSAPSIGDVAGWRTTAEWPAPERAP